MLADASMLDSLPWMVDVVLQVYEGIFGECARADGEYFCGRDTYVGAVL